MSTQRILDRRTKPPAFGDKSVPFVQKIPQKESFNYGIP